jgi:hypothetical protein
MSYRPIGALAETFHTSRVGVGTKDAMATPMIEKYVTIT